MYFFQTNIILHLTFQCNNQDEHDNYNYKDDNYNYMDDNKDYMDDYKDYKDDEDKDNH